MALNATITDSSAHTSTTTNPKEASLEQGIEKESATVETTAEQGLLSPEQDGAGSSQTRNKKSSSFKLAFMGIAASLFVFQLDATCLGIALLVRLELLFVMNTMSNTS